MGKKGKKKNVPPAGGGGASGDQSGQPQPSTSAPSTPQDPQTPQQPQQKGKQKQKQKVTEESRSSGGDGPQQKMKPQSQKHQQQHHPSSQQQQQQDVPPQQKPKETQEGPLGSGAAPQQQRKPQPQKQQQLPSPQQQHQQNIPPQQQQQQVHLQQQLQQVHLQQQQKLMWGPQQRPQHVRAPQQFPQQQGQPFLPQQFPLQQLPPGFQMPIRGPPVYEQHIPPHQVTSSQSQQPGLSPSQIGIPPGMPYQPSPYFPQSSQGSQQPWGPQQQPRGQQQRQGPQHQKQGPPPQQQRQGPPPQEQQQQARPQEQKKGPQKGPQHQQQRPPQQPSTSSTPSKEPSSPLLGEGDALKQLVAVKPGTKGRVIHIESNHLELKVGALKEAIHYDVAITPDNPKSLLRDVMVNFGRKHYPNRHPAFDGRKNLYTPTLLPFGQFISGTIAVQGENRSKEFKVEIKFARTVDLSPLHDMMRSKSSPQDALQCMDIVLRNAPSITCITAGRCFFTKPFDQIISLGDGMEMYYGFYQSAIRGWKPLLNVDVAHKAFPKSLNCLDLICELGSDYRNTTTINDLRKPLSDYLSRTVEKFLKQLKIHYEIKGQSGSKRIHRVNGLGVPASKAKFKLENGKEVTVVQYFQDVKRVRLEFPELPTVWVGAKDRESKILLPMEYCSVVAGQTVNRKMNENQTSAMIKKSATSTKVRKDKIMNSLAKANYNNDPCIREFGFSVNNNFERLDARVLDPPNLLYYNNDVVTPSRGVWRTDRKRFLIGATVKKWTIACVTRQPCRAEQLNQLADMTFRVASQSGMQMTAKATPPFVHVGGRQALRDLVEYFKTKQDFDLIFVVVPNAGPQYGFVKQAAELNVGCLTQCIKERTLGRLNPQTVVNILLKVNSKMNGTNHSINGDSRPAIMNRPCMIMGADVTHPSPDAKDIPSVAAVTASHDPKAFQYNVCWRLQPPKVEIIEDLCNITVEQLHFFYRRTKHKPERIVFFRDGVSEGQFKDVQRAEITAIRNACKIVQKEGYEPKITFLVVQKRHHTRLFPTNKEDSHDKNENVPAGTCVDTVITNPMMQDFYLVSHASIQGVAKPTKYCTLWDDNDLSNDDIEALTYHLCHMFTRCNRSVSYPAPTYYAHLAAARAKVYIENDKLNMDQLQKHQQNYQIKECISKDKPMFFV